MSDKEIILGLLEILLQMPCFLRDIVGEEIWAGLVENGYVDGDEG